MTADNWLWFASFHDASVQRYAITIDPHERDALRWLGQHAEPPALVASTSNNIDYLDEHVYAGPVPVRARLQHSPRE